MKTDKLENYIDSHNYSIPPSVCFPYLILWAWNKTSGSMDYYIAAQIKRAKDDNAPYDAIYYDDIAKEWHRLKDSHPVTQKLIKDYVYENTKPQKIA